MTLKGPFQSKLFHDFIVLSAQNKIQFIKKKKEKTFNFKQLIYWKMKCAGMSLSSGMIGLK